MKRFSLIVLSLLLVAACAVTEWETGYRVALPEVPSAWNEAWGAPHYTLVVQAHGVRHVSGGHTPGTNTTVGLPASNPVIVLAYPEWINGPFLVGDESMAPAGSLAVSPSESEVIEPRYEDGPAAVVLSELLESGVDLAGFNARRFFREFNERVPEDPWSIDLEPVKELIAAGTMRVSSIRQEERYEISVPPPSGDWYGFSPFAPVVTGEFPPLPRGSTIFYEKHGSRLVVTVEDNGHVWFVRFTR